MQLTYQGFDAGEEEPANHALANGKTAGSTAAKDGDVRTHRQSESPLSVLGRHKVPIV